MTEPTQPAQDAPFHEWLSYWLELRRMKPPELARKINRSPAYCYALANGTTHPETGNRLKPSAETAHAIAEALELLPEVVLEKAGYLKPGEQSSGYIVQRIAQVSEKLEPQQQQVVLELAESLDRSNKKGDNGEGGTGGQKPIGQTTPPHRAGSKSRKPRGGHSERQGKAAPPARRRA